MRCPAEWLAVARAHTHRATRLYWRMLTEHEREACKQDTRSVHIRVVAEWPRCDESVNTQRHTRIDRPTVTRHRGGVITGRDGCGFHAYSGPAGASDPASRTLLGIWARERRHNALPGAAAERCLRWGRRRRRRRWSLRARTACLRSRWGSLPRSPSRPRALVRRRRRAVLPQPCASTPLDVTRPTTVSSGASPPSLGHRIATPSRSRPSLLTKRPSLRPPARPRATPCGTSPARAPSQRPCERAPRRRRYRRPLLRLAP